MRLPIPPFRYPTGLAPALLTAALVSGLLTVASPTPAGGQARPVAVDAWMSPDPAEPGDDVEVRVEIGGCPPGEAVVEILRESTNGEILETALMAQRTVAVGPDWNANAELMVASAFEGWYGVRVVCERFRPPQRAMPGTYFPVGVTQPPVATVSGTTVKAGGDLRLSGADCPGAYVEYDLSRTSVLAPVFDAEGAITVESDGTWSAMIPYPRLPPLGRTDTSARCVAFTPGGEEVHIYYERPDQVLVTP